MADKPQALTLPLLITRALVIFPKNQQLIEAGRDFSISAVNVSKNECDSLILVTSQKQMNVENPSQEDVYDVGVLCHIVSVSERELKYWKESNFPISNLMKKVATIPRLAVCSHSPLFLQSKTKRF